MQRLALATLVALTLAPAADAHADVTVFYAPAVTRRALVAEPRATPPEETAAATFVRVDADGDETVRVPLVDASGRPSPEGLRELSLLARPAGTPRPPEAALRAFESDVDWVAPGLRRLHPALLLRLTALARAFPDAPIEVRAGYRPDAREGSRHRFGRALDLRVRGVSASAVHDALARLPQTGAGLYERAGFVHLDVRARSARWVERGDADVADAGPRSAPTTTAAAALTDAAPTDADATEDAPLDADSVARDIEASLAELTLDHGAAAR